MHYDFDAKFLKRASGTEALFAGIVAQFPDESILSETYPASVYSRGGIIGAEERDRVEPQSIGQFQIVNVQFSDEEQSYV